MRMLGVIIMLLALATEVYAAEQIRFSLWSSPTHPVTLAAKTWANAVNSAGSGKIEVTLFPAQQLGSAAEHFDLVDRGEVDMALVNFGYEPDRFPIASLALIPFTIRESKAGTRALDEWYRLYAPQELENTIYCLGFAQDPGTLHAKMKITSPDQLRGLKLRAGNGVLARYFALTGAKTVFLPAPDALEAVRRDEFDAMTFSYGSFFVLGLDRAMHHHIDIPLYSSFLGWLINRERYNHLSSDAKRILNNFCNTEQAGKVADQWAAVEIAGRERVRVTAGHFLHDLDSSDLTAWRQLAELLRRQTAEWMMTRNMNFNRIAGDLAATVRRRNAAF